MKYTLVYGTAEHTSELLEAARVAALKAFGLVAQNVGILVLDRYGIESEVMRTCQTWSIPLLVIGTTVRPRSGVSMKHYERAILSIAEHQDQEAQLRRYVIAKASGVVILGNTPDCRAMRVYASVIHKKARHAPTLSPVVPTAPDTDWIKEFGHHYKV